MLELRYRSDDVKSSNEQEQDSLSKLEEIAERYADVGEVQSQAALDLAAFGRLDASQIAIGRLEKIASRTQLVADQVELVMAKSSSCVVQKDMDGALKMLAEGITKIPEESLKFAKVAAQVALRASQIETATELRAARIEAAYSVLGSIPEEKLDFDAVVMLAGIADALKEVNSAQAAELIGKLERSITRLEKTEGEDGTNGRYLAAERLIANITPESNSQPLLEKASRYFLDIDARRPRWGLAASLGAKIASRKGDSEEAINLWRRAIRDGDHRVSTVMDLAHELGLVSRLDEAELELQRISGLTDSVVPISALAVSFALKRGDFSEALKRAEQLTISKPEEVGGWLLRAQTSFAASSGLGLDDTSQLKLRTESWTFLDKAHALSLGKNIVVWDARFRFKLLTGDKAGAAKVLEELLNAPLPEEVRLIQAGRRYLTLREYGAARECFEKDLFLMNYRSAEAYEGMADLHNAIGDNDASINALRKAHQLAPANQKIRDRLALNLAFSKKEKIEWQEVDSLISSAGLPTTARSTLLRALIGLGRGDKERQAKAVETLRDLARSSMPERDDAKRLLANYFARQWSVNANSNEPEKASDDFESAQRLFEELLSLAAPQPLDAARFADFLLSFVAKQKEGNGNFAVDYLAVVERVLKQLESATGSSVASLQLRIRLAVARGEDATIGSIADKWVQGAGDLESLGTQNLWEITGQTLMELGHSEASLAWLERVYEKDPKKYELLAIALAREQQYERALQLCVTDYHSGASPGAGTLIAEVAMLQPEVDLRGDASQVLKEALAKFPDSAELLEAVATMHLMQRRLPEAVSLYEMAEKIAPKRLRTLNNLAMALSEMPMRQKDALAKIERAIEIYGRGPDLLDTLGQIQLRNGRVQEAVDVLTEACRRKDDASFRIHLAQGLMAKKDLAAAKDQWAKINQSQLEGLVLTPEDKEFLKLLKSQFGEGAK